MQRLTVPGMYAWSRWQAERNMFFSSYLLVRDDGNVAFDPLPLDDAELGEVAALGGVQAILLTNRDHERAAAALRDRFGARIFASQAEADLFGLSIDERFEPGGVYLPSSRLTVRDDVVPGIGALALHGAKTPGEVIYVFNDRRAAIVGDALIGTPAGALSFLETSKLRDPQALALSLRPLWMLEPRALLLGDGTPLFAGVDSALGTLLESAGGPAVNRINLDELDWEPFDREHGRYKGESGEIGLFIGARTLGYRAVRLPPGARFCPLHAHDRSEEAFVVIDGTPTIRTLRGSIVLRAGDVMAFPTGDRGAHQLLNESDASCTVILFGLELDDEVAYYPDSKKVYATRRGLLMRAERLDYYDGE